MTQTQPYDVIIVGGGMVGMSLAVGLAQQGSSVAVIEKGAMPAQLDKNFDGRVSAIAFGSKVILDNIGAWKGMKAHAEPILDIRVSDNKSPIFLHYDHEEVGDEPFGYIVENRHIRHALQQAASEHESLTIFDEQQVKGVVQSDDSVVVELHDGNTLQAKLLVGADGKNSFVRKLAGIEVTQWGYKQTAIVCTIEHELPHHGLAQERFLPAGPFAVLPMQNNRSSLVWVEPDDRVNIYMELDEAEFVQEIEERVGGYLGKISTVGKRFAYPLSLLHAKEYTAGRIALIGDAAHGMHPIAGQGVNLGFRDVGVLLELIEGAEGSKLNIGNDEILNHYAKWRRFDNVAMLAATDSLNRLFCMNNMPVRLARNLGLWAVGKTPAVKRYFMRHAMGLEGDLPDKGKISAKS
ncbi:MAG: 2-octaprenyl-6-methoxyphenyl hydroxylase [Rickettsiales bacterium]